MKFDIINRFSGEVKCSVEIDCPSDALPSVKLGLAVKAIIAKAKAEDGYCARVNLTYANLTGVNLTGADLTYADLTYADLTDANLTYANLTGANLTRVNLTGADLTYANLTGVNLTGADLTYANLTYADLTDANLTYANLTGVNLTGADLTGADLTYANLTRVNLTGADLTYANLTYANLTDANLTYANLTGVNLTDADLTYANLTRADLTGANLTDADLTDEQLRPFKADFFLTLSSLHCGAIEAQHLIQKLRAGKVDGMTYGTASSECACLVGTIATARDVSGESLNRNSGRPAERWFMMIKPGDLPEHETGGGYASRKALDWALDWCDCHGIMPAEPEVAA